MSFWIARLKAEMKMAVLAAVCLLIVSPACQKVEKQVALAAPAMEAGKPAKDNVAGASVEASSEREEKDRAELKVFFIYPSPVTDAGWTKTHEDARRALEDMPGVRTGYVESVLGERYTSSILKSIAKENDLIFAASYEFMDPLMQSAKENPGVIFMHCSGYKRSKNVGTYFGRIYMARYLSGIVAGSMTRSGVIGYVAAFPIPEVIRGVNAFTLGAQTANPDVQVRLVWTGAWFNPELEENAARDVVRNGADVLAQHQNSPAVQQVAQEMGIYSVGYNHDMGKFAPDAQLTAAVWNWTPLYKEIVKRVKAGTWKSADYWWGLKEGVVDLAPFGPMVPDDVVGKTMAAKKAMIKGDLVVFRGPIEDMSGKIRIPAGKSLSDEELRAMNWYVKGVTGIIGK